VDNGTVIVLNIEDVTERFFFGSTKLNTSVKYIYINHIYLLKRFILYFKETAKQLIALAEKSKIDIAKIEEKEKNKDIDQRIIDEFLNDTKINKVWVRIRGQDYYISNNEAKILTLMKSGQTAKEISNEIGLSKKTVEIYRDKLKHKLDLFSRSNLVTFAKENSLLNINLLNDTNKKL
jgi:DNA-binding CsgD family transcriptional regulator